MGEELRQHTKDRAGKGVGSQQCRATRPGDVLRWLDLFCVRLCGTSPGCAGRSFCKYSRVKIAGVFAVIIAGGCCLFELVAIYRAVPCGPRPVSLVPGGVFHRPPHHPVPQPSWLLGMVSCHTPARSL